MYFQRRCVAVLRASAIGQARMMSSRRRIGVFGGSGMYDMEGVSVQETKVRIGAKKLKFAFLLWHNINIQTRSGCQPRSVHLRTTTLLPTLMVTTRSRLSSCPGMAEVIRLPHRRSITAQTCLAWSLSGSNGLCPSPLWVHCARTNHQAKWS